MKQKKKKREKKKHIKQILIYEKKNKPLKNKRKFSKYSIYEGWFNKHNMKKKKYKKNITAREL